LPGNKCAIQCTSRQLRAARLKDSVPSAIGHTLATTSTVHVRSGGPCAPHVLSPPPGTWRGRSCPRTTSTRTWSACRTSCPCCRGTRPGRWGSRPHWGRPCPCLRREGRGAGGERAGPESGRQRPGTETAKDAPRACAADNAPALPLLYAPLLSSAAARLGSRLLISHLKAMSGRNLA
jgi:hypothetical protein